MPGLGIGVSPSLGSSYAPFSPFVIGQPALYLDTYDSAFTLESTNRVVQWHDLSGYGRHATAASGSAARPTRTASGVVFDGVGNFLDCGDIDLSTCTLFFVTSIPTQIIDAATLLWKDRLATSGFTATSYAIGTNTTVAPRIRGYFGAQLFAGTRSNGVAGVETHRASNAMYDIHYNGLFRDSATASGITPSDYPLFLGCRSTNGVSTSLHINATFHALIIYPTALSDSEREYIERGLMRRFSIV